MKRPIVLIHGWSDSSGSFRKLQSFLRGRLDVATHVISLADWVSMDDDVTYRDLAEAMQCAWRQYQLPTLPRSVDVVVHSTGALVTREWMTRYHTPESVPLHRFLMLAPANFGSSLAHKGHSFMARAIKGWGSGLQTGRQILRGLELASPYTRELAGRDLFPPSGQRWYGRDRILATVLVGNTGYTGISSIANERGSDGTVRLSTANLNSLQLSLDFTRGELEPVATVRSSSGAVAFGVLDGENHSTIAMKDRGPKNPSTAGLILAALELDDRDFPATGNAVFPWQQRLDAVAPAAASTNPGLQTTVVHLRDDLDQDVSDYFFEFYRKPSSADRVFEQRFYREVIASVHPFEPNESHRALYLDVDALARLRQDFAIDPLYLSVAASPEFAPPRQPVGYRSFGEGDLGRYAISAQRLDRYFAPHRTVLLDIRIPRWVDSRVFRLGAAV